MRNARYLQQGGDRQGELFVGAFNAGRNTGPTEGPAIAALNDSASTVSNGFSDALSSQLKDAFNAYVDAAHAVANAIGTHAGTGEFNKRVDQLNDTKTKRSNSVWRRSEAECGRRRAVRR